MVLCHTILLYQQLIQFFIDYVNELYQVFTDASKDEIKLAREELKEMTPEPMNSILEKQPVNEAIEKRNLRKSMEVVDVPATVSVNTQGNAYNNFIGL